MRRRASGPLCAQEQYHLLPWRRNQALVYSGRIPHSTYIPPAAEARILLHSGTLGAAGEPPPRLALQTFLRPTAHEAVKVMNIALDGLRAKLGLLKKKA